MKIEASDILAMTHSAKPEIVTGIVDNQHFIADGGIDTPLRLAHFMAQLAHESAHFRTTLEFASGAAYEGRADLGNTHKGDGIRYRGRGLIQTTGRANYKEATIDIQKIISTSPDFEANPTQLEEFPWALLSGISYWRRRNINRQADRDDIRGVTKAINGGYNGLDSRRKYLAKAKAIFMDDHTVAGASSPVLRQGDKGDPVVDLQNELIDAGYGVLADGDFGQHTKDAVVDFQASHGLKNDGVVGAQTWGLLRSTHS